MEIRIAEPKTGEDKQFSNEDVAKFLFDHLDQYGDTLPAIKKAIDFAFEKNNGLGGFIVLGIEDDELIGSVVINKTGMSEYIPENILVYIAVDRKMRGKGAGKQLMKAALDHAQGNVALHVEPDNPAKFLYEKIGFTNKYLEMRYNKA